MQCFLNYLQNMKTIRFQYCFNVWNNKTKRKMKRKRLVAREYGRREWKEWIERELWSEKI